MFLFCLKGILSKNWDPNNASSILVLVYVVCNSEIVVNLLFSLF